ncbi:rhomboid family intramembrane serine protease [Psychromarinibacter halotolerans]|uniref:Rhomboid family intramembrane serine protease n=1 Tax=Psychromarinibacter halotolerans TaxID=1775175 RepID=A0ABV7H2G8_9RHOB|nr:rhomboid family intramembrane serine protease [Psychromarinibacter halotolerans]MDF0598568.1 rhomboid family intramembrane serine protease [Psychromarinibacter halotolerans]
MTDPVTRDISGPTPSASGTTGGVSPVLLMIAAVCILIELVLQGADLKLFGSPVWRSRTYQYGAFWPGLLHGWRPNYAAQPYAMFLTYAMLHGGLGHLAGNMFTLLALGETVVRRVGQRGFVLIYSTAALGGAALFGLTADGPRPMVGASGALFGLAAALIYWNFVIPEHTAGRMRRLAAAIGSLIVLNALLWVLLDGLLAWETHLGGFLAGWLAAWLLDRWARRRG